MTCTALSVADNQSGAMSIYDRIDPMAYIERFGKVYWVTGAGGAKTKEEGELLALACLCERKTIFDINREFHLMDGKLSMRADAMLAKFRQIGGKHKWIKTGDDGLEASCDFTFDGQVTQVKFTIEDAKRAGLVKEKGNWIKTPGSMLRARVISNAIRMIAPEVVAGYYTPEENEDVAAERGVAPAVTAETAAAVKKRGKELRGEATAATGTTATTSPATGDVVDAEFTVAQEAKTEAAAQTSPAPETTATATATVTESTPAETTAATTSTAPAGATTGTAANGSSTTATLMQIEVLLTKAGKTKATIEEQLRKKNPAFTTLDTLSETAALKLLANLQTQLNAKK